MREHTFECAAHAMLSRLPFLAAKDTDTADRRSSDAAHSTIMSEITTHVTVQHYSTFAVQLSSSVQNTALLAAAFPI